MTRKTTRFGVDGKWIPCAAHALRVSNNRNQISQNDTESDGISTIVSYLPYLAGYWCTVLIETARCGSQVEGGGQARKMHSPEQHHAGSTSVGGTQVDQCPSNAPSPSRSARAAALDATWSCIHTKRKRRQHTHTHTGETKKRRMKQTQKKTEQQFDPTNN